jgi:uncharacterized protein (DUF1778 family)
MTKKYTSQLSVTVTPEQKDMLQKFADERMTNVSQIVRQAIDTELEKLMLENVYKDLAKQEKSS